MQAPGWLGRCAVRAAAAAASASAAVTVTRWASSNSSRDRNRCRRCLSTAGCTTTTTGQARSNGRSMGSYSLHSWSGGKDSALSLYYAQQSAEGLNVTLITAASEDGETSSGHLIPLELMRQQAAALGMPIDFFATSWQDYQRVFVETLTRHKAAGADRILFGDIDLVAHKEWQDKVCGSVGLEPLLPLWLRPRRALAEAFIAAGFKAVVCCVRGDTLDSSFVGREYDTQLLADLPAGVCPAGEDGEFHTFVYDGPNFSEPVRLRKGRRHDVTSHSVVHHYQELLPVRGFGALLRLRR